MTKPSDSRRPIASRNSGWAQATAAFLARRNVSPNVISILSIVFSLVSLAAFYLFTQMPVYAIAWTVLAIAGIQGRLIMNLLDGMVAVEHGRKSPVGGIFNEVPDRISDTFILLGAGLPVLSYPYTWHLVYLAIALSIATAYIRTLGASLNCPHFFLGPMAKQHRMALITVAAVVAVWYTPALYYAFIVMNIGLLVTCYRRLAAVYKHLRLPAENA